MWFASFFSFVLAAWLTSRFCRPSSRLYILDHPNERSLHTRPTPRTGGVAIFFAILVGSAVVVRSYPENRSLAWIFAGVLVVAAVSFIDDRRGVPPMARFLVHVLGAGLVLASGVTPSAVAVPGAAWHWLPSMAILLSLLFVVWMVNLYNFMDGMDGLAGGMAVIGFGTLAAFGWLAGHVPFFALNLVVACAAGGFLVFNFPPARIFMGDVGSATLGLLAAAFSLWGIEAQVLPAWAAILVFSPFIVDATVTLVRRAFRGEKLWQAHRSHYYQKLVQLGFAQKSVLMGEYSVMSGCGASALLLADAPVWVQQIGLASWATFYFCAAILIGVVESRRVRSAGL